MAGMHENTLSMGEFPRAPLVEYLTRSVAVMYATRGLFVWLASTDVLRYEVLIRLIGWSNVLIGAMLLGIDLFAGFPAYWTWVEGPSIAAMGLLVVALERAARRDRLVDAGSD